MRRAQEKAEKARAKIQHEKDKIAKRVFDQQWSVVAVREAGEHLHASIRANAPVSESAIPRTRTSSHPICVHNRRFALDRNCES